VLFQLLWDLSSAKMFLLEPPSSLGAASTVASSPFVSSFFSPPADFPAFFQQRLTGDPQRKPLTPTLVMTLSKFFDPP